MITLWEAHRDLSESIGDSVGLEDYSPANPPVNDEIKDGVIFSKSLRNTFLYRAILNVLRGKLLVLAKYGLKDKAMLYYQIFPHTIVTETLNYNKIVNRYLLDDTSKKVLVSVAARLNLDNGRFYNIPIRNHRQLAVLFTSANIHAADIMMVPDEANGTYMYDPNGMLSISSAGKIDYSYLPYPSNLDDLDATDEIGVEDIHYPEILAFARMFAMADSLDYDSGQMLAEELKVVIGQENHLRRDQR